MSASTPSILHPVQVEALFHASEGPVVQLPTPGQMQLGSLLQLGPSGSGHVGPSGVHDSVQMTGSLVADLGGVSV